MCVILVLPRQHHLVHSSAAYLRAQQQDTGSLTPRIPFFNHCHRWFDRPALRHALRPHPPHRCRFALALSTAATHTCARCVESTIPKRSQTGSAAQRELTFWFWGWIKVSYTFTFERPIIIVTKARQPRLDIGSTWYLIAPPWFSSSYSYQCCNSHNSTTTSSRAQEEVRASSALHGN